MQSAQSPGGNSNAAMLPGQAGGVSSKMLYAVLGVAVANVMMLGGTLCYVLAKVIKFENMAYTPFDEVLAFGVGEFVKSVPQLADGVAHDVFTSDYGKLAGAMKEVATKIMPANCDRYCAGRLDGDEDETDLALFESDDWSCDMCQLFMVAGAAMHTVAPKFEGMARVAPIKDFDNVPLISGVTEVLTAPLDASVDGSLLPLCEKFAKEVKKPNWDMAGPVQVFSDNSDKDNKIAFLSIELEDTMDDIADAMTDVCSSVDVMMNRRLMTSETSKGFRVTSQQEE